MLGIYAVALVAWLIAAAAGPQSFAIVQALLQSPFGKILLLVCTFSFFLHLCRGIRHLGVGYRPRLRARLDLSFRVDRRRGKHTAYRILLDRQHDTGQVGREQANHALITRSRFRARLGQGGRPAVVA